MEGRRGSVVYLKNQMEKKSNNLEMMKFLAAWLVVIHHSFDLNSSQGEWIKVITNGQLDFGTMAVSLFFLASGLFIARSMEKAQTAGKFFKARFVRVWPPLAVVVVLSIVMGGAVTTLNIGAYWTSSMTWRYLLNAFFFLQHSLPGVFKHNIYGNAVNGALWTLPVEVACYVACYMIYKLGLMKKKKILYVMAAFLVCAFTGYRVSALMGIGLLSAAIRPIYFFLLGHVLYLYREYIVIDVRLFVFSLLGMVICMCFSLSAAAVWIFYPYVLLYLAFMGKQCGKRFAWLGNFSYTIYLCAFPLQQFIISCFGGRMNVYLHMVIALTAATAGGMLLHYGVEKRR